MIKTLVLIRDVLMYAGMLIGMFLIGYVRVSFSERQKKSPQVALDYNDKERKLRKAGIIILVITVALALIPTRNL
ncbi:MAG: hypothetical protein IIY30_08215 [Erysipelotrichaceae bacterium]|jgi:hypothetical protein|nr:hypothetical protein [Erysipelotrichaceae bacterium]MBQ1323760.1 hypothetical protein [Erysipelotrichaceae bacterium]MBQ1347057.1 hypothetical protein [Erysipelotrichaceae bacterium]MBQ1378467.1 hypothetical protein [Erysipelotrichaceae bacterium]MBQ1625056.1 hypothetical protein [Erysipelotrichaceae bacterium]